MIFLEKTVSCVPTLPTRHSFFGRVAAPSWRQRKKGTQPLHKQVATLNNPNIYVTYMHEAPNTRIPDLIPYPISLYLFSFDKPSKINAAIYIPMKGS